MIIPVRCITCGMPIGDVYDTFHKMKSEKDKKYFDEHNISPEKASSILQVNLEYDEFFEKLFIENMCCKIHLVTAIDFYKI